MAARGNAEVGPEEDPMNAELLAATRELFQGLESFRMAAASYFSLTVVETRALTLLSANGSLVQSELGTALALTPGAVTGLVDRLTASGVAVREAHPYDRRKTTVSATEHGEMLLRESHRWLTKAFSAVPEIDRATAGLLLHTIAVGLDQQAVLLADESPLERPVDEDAQLAG
ncbi:MAG: MarR family transcriptional regulator [Friedmanniella sp.]|nr:MarR family transcriptional regulator [Friedmanniella sp.]